MKTFELKRESWHYWLANFGEPGGRVHTETDICSYIRYVMIGSFWFTVTGVIGLAFVSWLSHSIGNLIGWLLFDYVLEKSSFAFFLFFGTIALLLTFIAGTVYVKEKVEESEPGFARLAYRSWKDKFCAKVKLV